jgi:hypothetical protein
MKLDLDLPTLQACAMALNVRIAEMRALGLLDSKWLKAVRALECAVNESLSIELMAERAVISSQLN